MTRRKKRLTLAEHDAALRAAGEYDAMIALQAKQEAERKAQADEWRVAERPLVEELGALKLDSEIRSVWDLVNRDSPYPSAIPVLLAHLQRAYPSRVREGIARALAVPEARSVWTDLERLYRDETSGEVKTALAGALAAALTPSQVPRLVALARDSTLGESRIPLLSALRRSTHQEAVAALHELERDPDLRIELSARRGRRR
jgi:hypothetical protein